MTAHLLRLSACVVVAALLIATGTEADAGKKGTPPVNYNDVISKLVAAHNFLNIAKHDYKGHRANAGTEINRAIHAVGGTSKGEISGAKNPKESQAYSDQQLRSAGQILSGVQTELAFIHSKTNDQRAVTAGKHVQLAINQIATALKIK